MLADVPDHAQKPDAGARLGLPHPVYSLARAEIERLSCYGYNEVGRGDDAVVLRMQGADIVIRVALPCPAFDAFVDISNHAKSKHLPDFIEHTTHARWSRTAIRYLDRAPGSVKFWGDINKAVACAYAELDERPHVRRPEGELFEIAYLLGRRAREHNFALDLNRDNILFDAEHNCGVFIDAWSCWG